MYFKELRQELKDAIVKLNQDEKFHEQFRTDIVLDRLEADEDECNKQIDELQKQMDLAKAKLNHIRDSFDMHTSYLICTHLKELGCFIDGMDLRFTFNGMLDRFKGNPPTIRFEREYLKKFKNDEGEEAKKQ